MSELHRRLVRVLPAPDEEFLSQYRDLCLEHNRYIDMSQAGSDILQIYEIGPDARAFEDNIRQIREGANNA